MSARRRPYALMLALLVAFALSGLTGLQMQQARASGAAPILLVVNSAAPNKFGAFLGEILRAEGIASFTTVELSTLDSPTLTAAKLVVLAETPLTSAQATLFTGYVAGGGRLVAMRPDSQLDATLGLTRAGTNTTQGYIAINTADATGAGLSGVSLPFYGTASNFTPGAGASTLAQLYSGRSTATTYAAVLRSGSTATWAYDLGRSVAYARQGNPANAGVDRDGQPPIRTTDIFYNAIDLERVSLPTADIQMRLFSRVLSDLLADSTPLPRLWYFPDAKRTILVLTGDDHGQPAVHFNSLVNNVASRGGRISLYAPRYAPNPTAADTATWRAAGHEVGLHPYAYADGVSFEQAFVTNENWFSSQGRGAPSRTERMHQVEWQGWTDAATVMANHGIGMDLSFYTWGPSITRTDGSQVQGYITGSGLPMRFVNESGALLPIYQQATTLIDEAMIGVISSYAGNYTTAQALDISRATIDQSQAGNYTALATQFHVDYYPFGEVTPWVHGIMDHAVSLGIPMWTAEHWLNYTEARVATSVDSLVWDAASGTLSFRVVVPASGDAQSLMLPNSFGGKTLSSATVNGAGAGVTTQTISGRATSFLSLGAGTHNVVASYVQGGQTPTSTPTVTQTATNTPIGPTATPTTAQTATSAPTSTPQAGSLVHSTVADFSAACVASSNSWVSSNGDGEVGLAGSFNDSFSGPSLGSAWVAGRWDGSSFSPTFPGGLLTLNGAGGAFVRSQASVTARTLEGVANFGAGPYQHVGWGSLDFAGNQYLLFSTFGTSSNLFARSNNNGSEQFVDLGPIPVGLHYYRIEWASLGGGQDQARYFIDGVLRATHTLPSMPSLYVYSSYNSGNSASLQVDALQTLPPYSASGSFTSCPLDTGATASWSSVSWQADTPANTSLSVEARSGPDGLAWGAWTPATSGAALASPDRFIQYRLNLAATNAGVTPLLASLSLQSGAAALPSATPTNTPVPATSTPTNTPAPATSTPTNTPVPATSTPTNTPVPPTSTPTITPTPLATPTVGLLNGGFESDVNADGRPDSWTSDASFGYDGSAGIARSGARAGRHTATTNATYNIDQRAGTGTIVPGKGYRLSGWVNIPPTGDSFTFRLQVRWLNSTGGLLSTTTVRSFTAATAGWTEVQSSLLRAPAGAVTAEVRMAVSSLNATVYIDDIAFTPASLLANWGFETDSNADGRPDSWTSSSRFLRSNSLVRSGAFAGQHTATTNPTYIINSSTITGLYAGSVHTVSGWVNIPTRADDFTLTVDVQWRDNANLAVGTTTIRTYAATTAGWEAFNQNVSVPTGATRVVVRMSVTSLNGTLYVDDFAFE